MIAASGQAQSSWNNSDGFWAVLDNWLGGLPGSFDDVFIGDTVIAENSEVTLDIDEFVNSITITDGMLLRTGGQRLRIREELSLDGANQVGDDIFRTTMRVDAVDGDGIGLWTNSVSMSNGAQMDTALDSHVLVTDTLRLNDEDNVIFNRGTIELSGNGTVLVNNGAISARSGQSRIEAPDGFLDLDGVSGNGVLSAGNQSAAGTPWGHTVVARGLTDPFDGRLEISGPNFIDMQLDDSWVLGEAGMLRFTQGSGLLPSSPTLRGSDVRIEGEINSIADNARIDAHATIAPSATVEVFGSDNTIRFRGGTVIEGGTFFSPTGGTMIFESGNDNVLQGGNFEADDGGYFDFRQLVIAGGAEFDGEMRATQGARVVLDSVIDANRLNTGIVPSVTNTWDLSADLTINADAIGNLQGQIVDPIHIGRNGLNAATWTVNLSDDQSYRLSGDIEIDHFTFGGGTTSIAGSDVAIDGDVEISGFTRFDARVDLVDNSVFMTSGGLEFAGGSLEDANTLDSVIFVGDETIIYEASSGVAVEGSAIIGGEISFDSGSSLIATETANGNILFLSHEISSVGTLGTRGESAQLLLIESYDTGIGDAFVMQDGQVLGKQIFNTNETGVRGHGAIGIAVVNDTVVAAEGGRLLFNNLIDNFLGNLEQNDLDGLSNEGELHAVLGSMTIVNESSDFGGTLRVAGSNDVTLQDTAFVFTEGSLVEMQGGAMISNELQTFRGELRTSDSAARLETDAVFTSSSSNKLVTNLVLTGETDIHAGAEFGSSGRLVNSPTGELTLFDGAAIGVDVTADGSVYLGDMVIDSGIGDASISDDLFLSGQLIVDLAGNAAPLYDQLAIADTITVRDAVFDVGYLAGFQAGAGDEFDILDFAIFEDFGYTLLLPELAQGLVWDSSDFETVGIIRVDFIPTPGTLTALLLAGATVTRRRRA